MNGASVQRSSKRTTKGWLYIWVTIAHPSSLGVETIRYSMSCPSWLKDKAEGKGHSGDKEQHEHLLGTGSRSVKVPPRLKGGGSAKRYDQKWWQGTDYKEPLVLCQGCRIFNIDDGDHWIVFKTKIYSHLILWKDTYWQFGIMLWREVRPKAG